MTSLSCRSCQVLTTAAACLTIGLTWPAAASAADAAQDGVEVFNVELAAPIIAEPPTGEFETKSLEAVSLETADPVVVAPAKGSQRLMGSTLVTALRAANRSPLAATERPLLPASYRVTNVAERIAQVADAWNQQGVASSHRHYCQMLLRKTVQQVTPAYNRYFGGSALETMRAFQNAGVGQPYKPGMQLLPGDLLYTARIGGDYGHAMIIGPDGRIRDNIGNGIALPSQRPIDWVVRPSGGPTRLASNR